MYGRYEGYYCYWNKISNIKLGYGEFKWSDGRMYKGNWVKGRVYNETKVVVSKF